MCVILVSNAQETMNAIIVFDSCRNVFNYHSRLAYSNRRFMIHDIPLNDITWKFSRSSGPGGQNVNKVNTKADMRIIIEHAYWIPDYIKHKLLQQQASHIYQKSSNVHELCIVSSEFRTQEGNKKICLEKLCSMIQLASKEDATPSEEQQNHVKDLAQKFQNYIHIEKGYKQDKKRSRRMGSGWKHDE